ncbi:hypothetical protein ACFPAF_15650 [Hymenobacter endophyticus]|uniref:Uncharacterized protein n=1 Tax=Hymenobacter endophyticus TaxID=3076335 RepID=A0ABU3TKD6_9BACT|nr:hypothetical protein [Hymenobacter endophyticus]MDU0371837.1 hypothetical protein [Hymenobacter endophyticus]
MPDSPTPASPANEPAAQQNHSRTPEQNSMPAELQTPANTTGQQPFADDFNHEQNEVAGASRGEFGRQSGQGVTQGGYGNEASRGENTYAGPLETPAATTGYVGEREQRPAGLPSEENGSFGTQAVGAALPAGSAVGTHFANDNAAPKGPDSGYAADYGTSSLGGSLSGQGQPATSQRNQHEDYTPNHPEGGPQGLHTGAEPTNANDAAGEADSTPNNGPRSGYTAAGSPDAQGGAATGFGSKGGSYNDEYDSAEAGQAGGSPAQGSFDRQDAARNYGAASDDQTQAEQSPDYGPTPGRTGSPD